MTEWESEDEYVASLTTNGSTLKSSSSFAKFSRQRSNTPSIITMSSSFMDKAAKRSSRDITTDESISILDPRRFTPTLHANLVSEILNLRRDQDEKIRLIESLEASLFSSKQEYETLQQNHVDISKESRSLKRQLSLLEGGTSSALGELSRERDEAVESGTETKKRLDAAQKKIRCQEDESQRVHEQWAREKESWENERRQYERKLHISETRLKTILEEVAALQNVESNDAAEDEPGYVQKDNDIASIRTMSITGSLRHSLINSPGPNPANGASLADELNFDDEETDADATESVFSSPRHKRTISRDSALLSRRHRRDLSLESFHRPGSAARSRLFFNPNVLGILQSEDDLTKSLPVARTYTDTGVQFSPPPSPKSIATSKSATHEAENISRLDTEIEANQRRKRVQPSPQPSKPTNIEDAHRHMVSVAAQTVETPLSPPRTPKADFEPTTPPPEETEAILPVCASTQTDPMPELPVFNLVPPHSPPIAAMPIPSISVQPPTSRPTTPRSPMLPPYMKNFGCQVNISYSVPTMDSSAQTEGIQVDKRLATLPPHLRPSAISSRPTSPVKVESGNANRFTPTSRNLRRFVSSPEELHSSPISSFNEDNDLRSTYLLNGNLESDGTRLSRRRNSFFSGCESASSDEAEEFDAVDVSDSEYRTALSAPRPQSTSTRPSKRNSFGTATTSPEEVVPRHSPRGPVKLFGIELYKSLSRSDANSGSRSYGRKLSKTFDRSAAAPGTGSSRSSDIRKHAMIQGSIASQQTRSRSPSLPESRNPPFPIPLRDSSKRLSFADATSEEHSPTRARGWQRRGSSHTGYRANSVRRVRSATAMPRSRQYRRNGSKSPPPLSVSTEAPESPSLPPLPRNDITTPKNKGSSLFRRHRHELSANTDKTDPMSPLQGSPQATGVVDAIAQTMVGEWMFKYVRRRKSFNMPDSIGKDDTANDRHKRWVWLAPYERSILWSSKQPSSGSALMGKTGRKLTIQSVLDVKDDNAVPKGAQTIFNRSILILTPQRALKFTASSSERHYLWLTALSFLAHSPQAVPENLSAPQPQVVKQAHQQVIPAFELPQIKSRRPGIRDSIRLAKNRTTANKRLGPRSVPSSASLQRGDVSFRLPASIGSSSGHGREASHDAAEPPMIERFGERMNYAPSHGRQRSNTGVQHVMPPLSFRGFSGPIGSAYDVSTATTPASSSDMFQLQSASNRTWGSSQRTSEASSRPATSPEQDELRRARRRSKEYHRRRSRSGSRNFDSFNYFRGGNRRWGFDDYSGGSRTAGEEEYIGDDLFKGF